MLKRLSLISKLPKSTFFLSIALQYPKISLCRKRDFSDKFFANYQLSFTIMLVCFCIITCFIIEKRVHRHRTRIVIGCVHSSFIFHSPFGDIERESLRSTNNIVNDLNERTNPYKEP